VRSLFNSSESILKAREAFLILDGGIRKNLREGILKSEKAFSTLGEAFEKMEHFNSGVRHSEFSQNHF
jgi:hypothetical protein